MEASTGDTPLLEMRGIVKRFPGLTALDAVDFSVRAGEMHALLGQNGAGKSTLMKVLAGVYVPDAGTIVLDGRPVTFASPRDALAQGIGIVYQDLSLVPKLTVTENIFLGREPGGRLRIDNAKALREAAALMMQFAITGIAADARVEDLSLAQQQLVEITRVLATRPRLLILDEPTASLAEEETELLFRILRRMRDERLGIIYISHRFREILDHCDRATVLRNGRIVKTLALQDVTETALIELTIGERVEQFFHRGDRQQAGEVALAVEGLRVGRAVRGVTFSLRRGEILGMTGLMGAGQNEIARALFGLMPEVSGLIRLGGQARLIGSPRQAIRLGIGLLTENRKTEGLVLDMNVRENLTLASLARFRRWLLFNDSRREREATAGWGRELQIRAASQSVAAGTLSGGNQQKVVLGKWLLRDPEVLIFIAPTQGIDVGAKAEIYQRLRELAAQGKAILVVSDELTEIMGISDRILVLYKGQIAREFSETAGMEAAVSAALQGNLERPA